MPLGFRSVRRGYASAPPRYIVEAPQILPQLPPAPQPIIVAAAPEDTLDDTFEYFVDKRDAPEVASNAVVLVDAVVQTSRPPSAAASPNPFRGVQIKGFFGAFLNGRSIIPVFEARADPHLPPPPAYANLAIQSR